MKATMFLLVALFTLPLFADERAAKRELIAELFETIDTKSMVQDAIEQLFTAMSHNEMGDAGELEGEMRARWEEGQKRQQEEMRAYTARLYARIDYVKFAETVYAPMIDDTFSADELRAVIAFAKTKPGQKLMQMVPRLGIGAFAEGTTLLQQASEAAAEEMEKEQEQKQPWRKTMADLRSIATATEARATDTNEYPVVSFEELEGLLSPTYIRTVPKTDSWGTPYLYVSDGKHYRFVSAGADKRFEWNSRTLQLTSEPQASGSLDADIIFQDGIFLQYPKEAPPQR